jgi:ferrous iron transport protein B
MGVSDQAKADAVNAEYAARKPIFAPLLKPAPGDKDAAAVRTAVRAPGQYPQDHPREMKNEQMTVSFLGTLGEWLLPVTKYAGFDVKVNISLLAAFAAKENTVSTLGALYTAAEGEKDASLDQRLKTEMANYTPLHALALMLFMVLYPPCLATSIMVQLQTRSTKWMLFSIGYLMFFGHHRIVRGLHRRNSPWAHRFPGHVDFLRIRRIGYHCLGIVTTLNATR